MKLFVQPVRDPISGFLYTIQSPFELKKRVYSCHPAYQEPFDVIYKETKRILLTEESKFNIESKQLAFGILLFKLAETGVVQFRQFKTLKPTYAFFNEIELLTKLFFIIPKIVFGTEKFRLSIPGFRITGNDIEYLGIWIDRVIHLMSERDRIAAAHGYDEELTKYLQIWDRWKMYSSSPDKLPAKVLHYIVTITSIPPAKLALWKEFFVLSSGQLYLRNRARSLEAFNLFWELLHCIDHIECSDYHNSLTFGVVKFLKKKVEEWVSWEPSFLDISLDYKLLAPKKEAWDNAKTFWIKESAEHKEQAEERQKLAETVRERIAKIRAEKAKEQNKPVSQFTIIHPNNPEKKDESL